MNKLTENWKNGEIEFLDDLIKQIEDVDNSRSLSDEYLKEKKNNDKRGMRCRCRISVRNSYGHI